MQFLKHLLNAIIIITIASISIFWYMGFFDTVYLVEKTTGPYYALMQDVQLFDDATDVRNTLFNKLLDKKIVCNKGIAITTPPFEKLNSKIIKTGWIIENKDIHIVEKQFPHASIINIPKQLRIAADFPYKNTFSTIGGTYKSYNAMLEYANKNNYTPTKVFEIYDDKAKTIFYLMEYK